MTVATDAESKTEVAIPTQQRAAVYRAVNDVRVETVAVPTVGPGEVLMKIHTCVICGTDLKKIHTGSHSAPRIFGHEMAGTIARVKLSLSGAAFRGRTTAIVNSLPGAPSSKR